MSLPSPVAHDARAATKADGWRHSPSLATIVETDVNGHPYQRGARSARGQYAPHMPVAFGVYSESVRRQEEAFGMPAPVPTVQTSRGGRLNPLFVEWMMGLPEGHVTSQEIGLSRVQQLRALGNGVVPQQAAHAIRLMAGRERAIEWGCAA